MANELNYAWNTATDTLYAIVRRVSDKYVYNGSTFEAWNDANITTYDITMTASGKMFFGNFPVIAAGTYKVEIRQQAGVNPAITDTVFAEGEMIWDGTAEILPSDIAADLDSLLVAQQQSRVAQDTTALPEPIAVIKNL